MNVDPIKQLLLHVILASVGKRWAQTSHTEKLLKNNLSRRFKDLLRRLKD